MIITIIKMMKMKITKKKNDRIEIILFKNKETYTLLEECDKIIDGKYTKINKCRTNRKSEDRCTHT